MAGQQVEVAWVTGNRPISMGLTVKEGSWYFRDVSDMYSLHERI